jgi:hypothetical protein
VLKQIGQTQVFQSAAANLRSVLYRINQSSLASNGFSKVNGLGPTKGLGDIEMNPVNNTTCGTSYVSTGSRNSILESGPQDDVNKLRRQDHIFVRRDFSVE